MVISVDLAPDASGLSQRLEGLWSDLASGCKNNQATLLSLVPDASHCRRLQRGPGQLPLVPQNLNIEMWMARERVGLMPEATSAHSLSQMASQVAPEPHHERPVWSNERVARVFQCSHLRMLRTEVQTSKSGVPGLW